MRWGFTVDPQIKAGTLILGVSIVFLMLCVGTIFILVLRDNLTEPKWIVGKSNIKRTKKSRDLVYFIINLNFGANLILNGFMLQLRIFSSTQSKIFTGRILNTIYRWTGLTILQQRFYFGNSIFFFRNFPCFFENFQKGSLYPLLEIVPNRISVLSC